MKLQCRTKEDSFKNKEEEEERMKGKKGVKVQGYLWTKYIPYDIGLLLTCTYYVISVL